MSQDIEYQHTPDGMVVLLRDLKKAIADGKPVVFTQAMLEFVYTECERLSSDHEAMVEFLLEREIITETMAHEWKSARRVTRK